MTLTALLISLFIQFGFINTTSDASTISPTQQQEWTEIIDDDLNGF